MKTRNEYRYLDKLAVKTGTDKGSNYHNYTEIYAKYFSEIKEKPIKFLEIGILEGMSVKLWEKYFKKADLHFMDITFEYVKYFSKRSHYHLYDQENPDELEQFIEKSKGNFDVIIDDGGHTMNQQITSFKKLFPHLTAGGLYIIEDLHTSYWNWWPGGNTQQNTVGFLKSLIDEVNFVGAKTKRASHLCIAPSIREEMNMYREHIQSMHFYDSLVVIIKR